MSLIDVLLLGAVLAVSAGWIFAPRSAGRLLAVAPYGLVGLAILQLASEGFYWQFLPAYGLVLAAAVLAVHRRRTSVATGRLGAVLGAGGLIALMLSALGTWTFLPVPELTAPGGPYPVGTETFRLVDTGRPEDATPDPADRRNVVVQAWYPAAPGGQGPPSTYIDGLGRLPAVITLIPGFVLRRYEKVDTHARVAAPISAGRPTWPVVLFSPGYGGPRAFYTSLVTGLASKGFVVLAIDHPYEAAVTELADGRIATTVEVFSAADPDRTAFMNGRLELRAADLTFVLDRLNAPGGLGPSLSGRLDLAHIGAIGHSLGGATAAVAMDRDPRIKAAANIDGTLYGAISGRRLERPFLLLESDHAESGHGEANLSGNRRLLGNLRGGGYRYEIYRANHYSFTDAPLFLSPPARVLLARFIGGSRGPSETHRATVDILAAFLQEPLTGAPASVEAAVRRYPAIAGGPVPAGAPRVPRGAAPAVRRPSAG